MESMELYIFKSCLALSFLYIFYLIALRNETYYSWNRIYLLVSLIISLVFPLVSFSMQNTSTGTVSNILEPIIIKEYFYPDVFLTTSNTLSILSIIYISGAVFFCLRFLSNLAKIHYLYFRFPKLKYNGFKAVVINNNQSPFTFFNILFISRDDYENNSLNEIIVHEKAHRDEYHSFDIILMELLTIIQWFNPFLWLFRLALRSEHEFVADNKVLIEGFDKVKYQKLLFEKSLGITPFILTNSFNYSLLKKRLKMMTNNKSGSLVKIKYLLSIPILLITLLLLAINFNSYGQDDTVYTQVDVMPLYKNTRIEDGGVRQFIQQNITYPESARKNNISAKIYVQFVVDEKGDVTNVEIARSDILDNVGKEIIVKGYRAENNTGVDTKSVSDLEFEAKRIINLLEGFTPGKVDNKNVKTQFTFPITFVLGDKKDK